jgi:NADH-quinone oxidoreductase subunit C
MTEQERGEGAPDENAPSAEEADGRQPQAGGPAAPEKGEVSPPPAVAPEAGATPEEIAAEGEPVAKAPEAPPKAEKAAKAEAKGGEKTPLPPGSIADAVKAALPELQFEAYQGMTDVIIEIGATDVPSVMPVLKDDPRLDLKLLRCLSGVDHETEGMEVVYHLMSVEQQHELEVKVKLPAGNRCVASVTPVWNAADWHEREARDMFGIEFDGHPHLVPLLLPEDMTDHFPLRKDNPLADIEEWQGELLGENVGSAGHIPSGPKFEGVGSDASTEE